MGVKTLLITWLGGTLDTAETVKAEVHEKAIHRLETINRTRDEAVRAITEKGDGMSFDELAHTVGLEEDERRRGTHREDDRKV